MNKVLLIIFLASSFWSCSKTRENEIHYIPVERLGTQVIIRYNKFNGTPKRWLGNARLYEIPKEGDLDTKFKANYGWFGEDGMQFYLVDGVSKKRLAFEHKLDLSTFFIKYRNEIGVIVTSISEGSFSYVVDTVNLERYREKKLYLRPDLDL